MKIPESEYYHETKGHGGRGFPFTIYPCSIPLDFRQVPVHWHEELEIVSVKKGRGLITVDRGVFPAVAGEAVVIFPGQLHGISQMENEDMEYENIIFDPNMLLTSGEDECGLLLEPIASGMYLSPLWVREQEASYKEFSQAIEILDSLCSHRPKGYQLAVKSALYYIMYLLCSVCEPGHGARPRKSKERMKRLLEYVESRYAERITIEEAASLCYYSKSHFMKFFRQYMGMSFVEYLNGYRLGKAAERLIKTADSVTVVAQSCGFDNISYFNRQFRAQYHCSPREYRGRKVPFIL